MAPTAKSLKRIQKDMLTVKPLTLETNGCYVEPDTFDKPEWHVYIQGPVATPWEKGVFKLKMSFPDNYPFDPVKINFDKGIYHPNVGTGGSICLDIIKKEAWSPSMTLHAVFMSIRSLLSDPNPDSPMNGESARQFKKDKKGYEQKVKETVNKFGQCLPKHKRQGLHSEKPDEKALEKLNLKPAKTTSGAGEAQAPQPSGASSSSAPSSFGSSLLSRIAAQRQAPGHDTGVAPSGSSGGSILGRFFGGSSAAVTASSSTAPGGPKTSPGGRGEDARKRSGTSPEGNASGTSAKRRKSNGGGARAGAPGGAVSKRGTSSKEVIEVPSSGD